MPHWRVPHYCALENGDRLERIRVALLCAEFAYRGREAGEKLPAGTERLRVRFQSLSVGLNRMLASGDLPSALVASLAFVWVGERRMLVKPPEPEMLVSLYRLWRKLESDQAFFSAGLCRHSRFCLVIPLLTMCGETATSSFATS